MDLNIHKMNSSSNIIYGKYEIVKHLGRGSFSEVFLVKYKGQLCAMKEIRMKDYNNREVMALKKLNHINIVKLIEVDESIVLFEFRSEKCFNYFRILQWWNYKKFPIKIIRRYIFVRTSNISYLSSFLCNLIYS